MTDKQILVVDDDSLTRETLSEMLSAMGYEAVLAENGKVAVDLYNKTPFQVVITDIEMPVMDGKELINQLNEMEPQPLIIVETAHDDLDLVIDTMKRGVYDYIIKPINASEISFKLKKAFHASELQRTNWLLKKERIVKLESQLEWLQWNETFIKREHDRIDQALFKSLQTSFNQGAGFGALLTLVELISSSAQLQNDKYVIDKELFDMIKDSAELAKGAIDTFSKINNIFNNEFVLDRISVSKLHGIIEDVIKEADEYTKYNNQAILFSDKKSVFDEKYCFIDNKFFRSAIFELLINALKFSKKNTKIFVIMDYHDQNLNISIINNPDRNDKGVVGIPIEYGNIVFEPFFRLSNNVYEKFNTIDFGLGLTSVAKIVAKHNSKISVSNIIDNSNINQEPITKVNFLIKMPLERKDGTISEQ